MHVMYAKKHIHTLFRKIFGGEKQFKTSYQRIIIISLVVYVGCATFS